MTFSANRNSKVILFELYFVIYMRHASCNELNSVSDLIDRIRTVEGISERSPCHFYFKNRGILHFHLDSGLLYADVDDQRIDLGKLSDPDMKKVELVFSTVVKIITESRVKKVFER